MGGCSPASPCRAMQCSAVQCGAEEKREEQEREEEPLHIYVSCPAPTGVHTIPRPMTHQRMIHPLCSMPIWPAMQMSLFSWVLVLPVYDVARTDEERHCLDGLIPGGQ